jgi:hypothetical protein
MWLLPVPDTAWTVEASIRNEQARQHQEQLDRRLGVVLREGSLESIKELLDEGARLTRYSIYAAVGREDLALLEMLFEYGWDIDTTQIGRCAIE